MVGASHRPRQADVRPSYPLTSRIARCAPDYCSGSVIYVHWLHKAGGEAGPFGFSHHMLPKLQFVPALPSSL